MPRDYWSASLFERIITLNIDNFDKNAQELSEKTVPFFELINNRFRKWGHAVVQLFCPSILCAGKSSNQAEHFKLRF